MLLALVAVLAGLALMLAAGMSYRRDEQQAIDDILGLTPLLTAPNDGGDDGDGAGAGAVNIGPVAVRAVAMAGQIVQRVDPGRSLGESLERAKIPLRPAEFVVVMGCASVGVAAFLFVSTGAWPLALGSVPLTALAGRFVIARRIAKRRRAFEQQLPDALTLVASSLRAGHTFLRAIQIMCEESSPPLAEEFARVVNETRLGDPIVAALERMAQRLEVRDMDMVVQAIRIQQTVGGKLADLLHTLADFIRARDDVRREVRVLTAEGRMSAYVLAGLVPFLFAVIKFLNPTYVEPLFHGWGLVVLAMCGGSVVAGMLMILRMVRIDI